ncbi:MAG: diaminopimelate decarboxylase [Rhodospirillales bacterium]|jgi:diaminopimelate decarboxylase|nr:diaminopimelate decarboxylase [Rhodospirillales bacterium]
MDHFQYQDGELCAESVPLARIAAKVGTPFYCYATATLERHYTVFADAFEGLDTLICFAVKANSNISVLRTLARLGAGADVVSGGELKRALVAGVAPDTIVFSGVGKTRDEMAEALAAGVLQINVESEPELEALGEVARAAGVTAPVAIRVNPDVDARTHAKIATGKGENKFGVAWTRAHEVYAHAAAMDGIDIVGVAIHIGSQITDLEPFRDAYVRVRDLVATLRADGHPIQSLDVGGGLGIPYSDDPVPSPAEYGAMVRTLLGDAGCRIILEPGRVIAGNAGVLVTRVLYMKEGATHHFAIVDAAMNDLLRPALYDAVHAIVPVTEAPPKARRQEMDVVGPICETGDLFASGRPMPPLEADDLLAIRTAGAYCAVMASTYNSRPLVPEVLVNGDTFAVVRETISVDTLLSHEPLPDWLASPATASRRAARAAR